MAPIHIKRIYEPSGPADGFRVLIDRLWPRGVSKEDAAVDLWMKEIAPTSKLRTWFAHDPAKWDEFQLLYREELERNPEPVTELIARAKESTVTLLFAAKDKEHNHAPALRDYIRARL
jgi:uncharacterized protein YeaO (DUF488 family)